MGFGPRVLLFIISKLFFRYVTMNSYASTLFIINSLTYIRLWNGLKKISLLVIFLLLLAPLTPIYSATYVPLRQPSPLPWSYAHVLPATGNPKTKRHPNFETPHYPHPKYVGWRHSYPFDGQPSKTAVKDRRQAQTSRTDVKDISQGQPSRKSPHLPLV